jgi:hypothetical protein
MIPRGWGYNQPTTDFLEGVKFGCTQVVTPKPNNTKGYSYPTTYNLTTKEKKVKKNEFTKDKTNSRKTERSPGARPRSSLRHCEIIEAIRN